MHVLGSSHRTMVSWIRSLSKTVVGGVSDYLAQGKLQKKEAKYLCKDVGLTLIIEISAKRCILCLCSQPKMCDYHLVKVRKSTQKHLAEESQVSSPSSQLIGLLQCHLLGFLATMRTNLLTLSPATE